jgi:hypothetical protein
MSLRRLVTLLCLVLVPCSLIAQDYLALAKGSEADGRYDSALHFYSAYLVSWPRSKQARAGAERCYWHQLHKEAQVSDSILTNPEPTFRSYDELVAWEKSLKPKASIAKYYYKRLKELSIPIDTVSVMDVAITESQVRFQAIRTKWRRILADDQWVKAVAEQRQLRQAAAYQYALAALKIRPELIREPAFDSLILGIRQHAIKVAILPFEDLTYQGNGLHRQVFVRVLEAIDTLDVPVLDALDGSYLGLRADNGLPSEGAPLPPRLAEARARGATFALVGRLTRAINGAVASSAANQTAYLSRQANGNTVADIPVNYQEVTRTRELQVDLECELVNLADGRVLARQTLPYSSTEQLSYSAYSGGSPSDLSFYRTSENTSKSTWAAAGNLASTILEITDGSARRRSFSAPREFGPLVTVHEQAREHLTRQVVNFYLLAAKPLE